MVLKQHLIYLHSGRQYFQGGRRKHGRHEDVRRPGHHCHWIVMSVTSRRGVAAVPHRVIQWGTGNTGAHTLRFLLEDPAFDVVGVWVKREQNIGRTAGELAGLAVDGPSATQDVDDLVAMAADCVVYMAAEPTGSPKEPGTDGWESVHTMCRLLASGKNVVATGISGLTNPRAFGNDVYDRLRQAAEWLF
jgi:hypothetical protein